MNGPLHGQRSYRPDVQGSLADAEQLDEHDHLSRPDSGPGSRRSGLIRQTGNAGVVAAVAVASGLLLDVAIAARLGAGRSSDAYFAGIRLPLGIVAIVMVATNQALVPLFSTWKVHRGNRALAADVGHVLNATVLVSTAAAAAFAALAGPLVAVTVPGFDATTTRTAISVARITVFVIPLVCAAEVLRAYLNARFAYVVAAAMNVSMNVVAAAIVFIGGPGRVLWVAWAYLIGAAAQLLFMAVMSIRRGWRPTWGVRAPAVRDAGRHATRPLVAASLNPAARLVEQAVVSFLPPGTLTVVHYGYRLVSAVGGAVFFRSVTVALVPRLTEAVARGDEAATRRTTALGIKVTLAIALPLTAFMAVLASPAVQILFRRGSFEREDARLLGLVLAVYAASLVGSGLQRALLSPFFARLDTRTPLRNTAYGVAANLLVLVVLVQFHRDDQDWAVAAIALAYSGAQYVNVAHAAVRLRQTVGPPFAGTYSWTMRLSIASAAAGAVMWGLAELSNLFERVDRATMATLGAATGVAGGVTLVLALAALLRTDLRTTVSQLRRRRPPS